MYGVSFFVEDVEHAREPLASAVSKHLLTLGAHAQRGLQYFVCLSVCLCVCLSVCLSVTTSLAHLAAKSLKFGRR